mmetsp:Transcript_23485/g.65338  ORF Transcript_23485/g.65338 Transcript_23485/m.65338 type:complete len:460 (+) Transcript_23485:24-1403(+)
MIKVALIQLHPSRLTRKRSSPIISCGLGRFDSRCSSSSLRQESEYEVCDELPQHVAELVQEHASMDQTPFSLQLLMRSGQGDFLGLAAHQPASTITTASDATTSWQQQQQMPSDQIVIQMANMLRQELPIRLAYRIQDLDQIPLLRDMEAVQHVKKIYIDSFLEILSVPTINTTPDEHEFATLLEGLYTKHSSVLVQMARGAYQLRAAVRSGRISGSLKNEELEFERMNLCHNFLDRFYTSRIGIRVLAGQYLALRGPDTPHYVGMIYLKASPSAIVRKAIEDASLMCQRQYGRAPSVDITGRLDLSFPYIPTYLHYILLELLKNAMRATCERYPNCDHVPPVTVVIADGQDNEDVVIKIMDEGGGIKRSVVDKIWSYLFTTAGSAVQDGFIGDQSDTTPDHDANAPIAGLGYGLPISRSYCRYFGGDLDLMSMEGYGTDAFVHLKRLGDSKEPLPVKC